MCVPSLDGGLGLRRFERSEEEEAGNIATHQAGQAGQAAALGSEL